MLFGLLPPLPKPCALRVACFSSILKREIAAQSAEDEDGYPPEEKTPPLCPPHSEAKNSDVVWASLGEIGGRGKGKDQSHSFSLVAGHQRDENPVSNPKMISAVRVMCVQKDLPFFHLSLSVRENWQTIKSWGFIHKLGHKQVDPANCVDEHRTSRTT